MCPFEGLRKQENERQSKIIKESYLKKILNINENNIVEILNEKKADLDRYTINLAEDLLEELKLCLVVYIHNGNKNTDNIIKMKNGMIYFKPTNKDLNLHIYLNKRNNDNPGGYNNKLNTLLINVLNDKYEIDEITIALLNSIGMLTTFGHELAHYISDSRKKAAGKPLNLNIYKKDKINYRTYINNTEEINSLIKEVEIDCMKKLNEYLPVLFKYLDIEDQKDYFADTFKFIMNNYKNDKSSRFYEPFNNLDNKNLNKVYKDTYNYCLDEFLKYKIVYDDNQIINTKIKKRINNSDALNKWLSDHKF